MRIEPWETLTSELLIDNRWMHVRRDSARLPTGLVVPDYYYIEGGDFGQVFAVTVDQQVVFVRQYKYPVRAVTLELPAGAFEPGDADPLAGTQRELAEETGYGGGEWLLLGECQQSPGKSTTRSYPFLATGVRPVGEPHPDPTEAIEVVLVPLGEVVELLTSGAVQDTNSQANAFLALRALHII